MRRNDGNLSQRKKDHSVGTGRDLWDGPERGAVPAIANAYPPPLLTGLRTNPTTAGLAQRNPTPWFDSWGA